MTWTTSSFEVKHVIAKTNKNNFKNMKFEYIQNTSTTFKLICMPHKKHKSCNSKSHVKKSLCFSNF